MPDPNILVRWSQHLLQTSPPFYINTTEEPYEQAPPTCMQGPTLGKLCLDCQQMGEKKYYGNSVLYWSNLNSGLLSKTIEKAFSMDMSLLDSSLILSVCIHEEKKMWGSIPFETEVIEFRSAYKENLSIFTFQKILTMLCTENNEKIISNK